MTQEEKIIGWLITHPHHQWWYAPDFMQPNMGEFFVGYEASAVMSRLTGKYPVMFNVRKDGRFRYIQFRFDNLPAIQATIPDELWRTIRGGLPYKIMEPIHV